MSLHRTWKSLLKKASETDGCWVNGLSAKRAQLITVAKSDRQTELGDDCESDDYSDCEGDSRERRCLYRLNQVAAKMVNEEEATCKLYTVHAAKGLEHDNVSIDSDLLELGEKEKEVLYVALTRGMLKTEITGHVLLKQKFLSC